MTRKKSPSFSATATAPTSISLAALTPLQLAALLTRAGATSVTESSIRRDIDSGCPTNPDGTIDLTHYIAWLVSEVSHD